MFEVDFSIHLSMSRAVFECDYRTVYVPCEDEIRVRVRLLQYVTVLTVRCHCHLVCV